MVVRRSAAHVPRAGEPRSARVTCDAPRARTTRRSALCLAVPAECFVIFRSISGSCPGVDRARSRHVRTHAGVRFPLLPIGDTARARAETVRACFAVRRRSISRACRTSRTSSDVSLLRSQKKSSRPCARCLSRISSRCRTRAALATGRLHPLVRDARGPRRWPSTSSTAGVRMRLRMVDRQRMCSKPPSGCSSSAAREERPPLSSRSCWPRAAWRSPTAPRT